jgi:ribonuclease HI
VLKYKNQVKEISGGEPHTTNQRMELLAAIKALESLKRPCRVRLHTDSAYLTNAFKLGWLNNWSNNGWMNARKEPVANRDLWLHLLSLSKKHEMIWVKVKGHAGEELNERCDQLARLEIDQFRQNQEGSKNE